VTEWGVRHLKIIALKVSKNSVLGMVWKNPFFKNPLGFVGFWALFIWISLFERAVGKLVG